MDAVKDIRNVVLSAISRLRNHGISSSDYMFVLEIAISSYQEKLRGFEMPSLVSAEIEINLANRVWAIPSDFIALSRVSYRDGKNLWDLTYDGRLDLTQAPTPCESPTPSELLPNDYFIPNFYLWNYTAYGEGGGKNVNYYRIDHERRRILFAESIPVGTGVIEYLSAGKGVNETTFVPLPYVDAFRSLIMWKVCELSDKPNVYSLGKDFQSQYQSSLWDANILAKSPSVREILDSLYAGSGVNYR